MLGTTDSIDTALQVCFGILGFIGVLAAIASISYEESLGAFVFQRLLGTGPTGKDQDRNALELVD